MSINTNEFKDKIVEKIYSNTKNYVIKMETNGGWGIDGIIECDNEEPINFCDNDMIIALANDLKCNISLNESQCEIVSDEEEDDTYIIKNKESSCTLTFCDSNE